MTKREQDQEYAGNAEVAANPDHFRQVENEINEQGDGRKDYQPEVERKNFSDEKTYPHATRPQVASGMAGSGA